MVRVEAATACQLRCPTCPTGDGKTRDTIGIGYLSPENFETLLEKSPWIRHVELSNWGEIFLNPRLETILECAHRRGVTLSADNGANFNYAADRTLEALVTWHLRSMTCSIDGASEETYKVYRRGGSFERVVANIRRLNELKARHGSDEPRLLWQFVAFGHNEHEIPAARSLAESLDMAFSVKLAWQDLYADRDFSPILDAATIRNETGTGAADRQEYYTRHGERYLQKSICTQLWTSPQINWDGRMLGCCVNYWGDFGNVFRDGLEETFRGEKMTYARKMLAGQAPPRADIPCVTCTYYQTMKQDNHWITPGDIAPPLLPRAASAAKRLLAHLDPGDLPR